MINSVQKSLLLYAMIILFAGCSDPEEFDIYSYHGSYPRNMDGSQIKTYEPLLSGGDAKIDFNGHLWNHSPYIRIFAAKFSSSQSGGLDKIEIMIQAMRNNDWTEPCGMEHLYFRLPLRQGVVDVNGLFDGQNQSDNINFISVDCDATKDRYGLDTSKNNLVRIIRYDNDTQELELEFNVHFKMLYRNSDFGPIYPEEVKMKGTLETMINM
jgi:hypothetical protein